MKFRVGYGWLSFLNSAAYELLILYTCYPFQLACGICFETLPRDGIKSAACGHPFCTLCWAGLSDKL